MPKKSSSGRKSALHEMTHLRSEVRQLGSALGRVITRLEGSNTFDTVEALRQSAKGRRAGNKGASDEFLKRVAHLDPAEAINQAMAFTLYFELVNLAEENFRISLLRQRRAAQAMNLPGSTPMRESIESAVIELKKAGTTPTQFQEILNKLDIELVFTAHPTETKRRTLLTKLERLAAILRSRAHPEACPDPYELGVDSLEREIASLWLTDRSRSRRPEVTDEALTGLWYFDRTLFQTLPRLQEDMVRALARHYPSVKAPKQWLTFGSWIGGDRDGNPNVTADVTAAVLVLNRRLAIEKMRLASRDLARTLTVSDRRDTVVPAVKREIEEGLGLSKPLSALGERYPHEPYRLLLGVLRERLAEAAAEMKDGSVLAKDSKQPLLEKGTIEDTLESIRASLASGKGALLIGGELTTMTHQLDTFGLHTAKLDLRQHSSLHEAAVAELLGDSGYPQLEEEAKRAKLLSAISSAKKLSDDALAKLSAATRGVVDPLLLVARAVKRFGSEALGIYIISMTDGVSDLLEVEYLQALTGVQLPIAPLFETLDDLQHAPDILGGFFDLPHRKPEHQHVMLGYSDSNKDCGYVSANWALYRAQDTISALCQQKGVRVTLFHGRGGSIARGGGPAAKAILAQPAGLRDGGIRVTEQGEVLSTRYHDPDLAHRILEQMAYGVMLGIAKSEAAKVIPAAWAEAMETMSATGFRAYEALVHNDPEFLTFWRQATPIEEISQLKLGSRPTYRKATTSVSDLRAIPWVFSWMQSRFNFPGWFGLGAALESVLSTGPKGKKLLRQMHAEWPFFQTLIDNAQLTMRKADMGIAAFYAELVEDPKIRKRILSLLEAEFARAEKAILAITGQKQLLGREPVLLKSVELRNPYIDPLNMIQVDMMRRLRRGKLSASETEQVKAVIELTINGISGGLKNTG